MLDPIRQVQAGTGSVTNSHLPPQLKTHMPKLKAKNREKQSNLFFSSFSDGVCHIQYGGDFRTSSKFVTQSWILLLCFGSPAARFPSTGPPASNGFVAVGGSCQRWKWKPPLRPSSARNKPGSGLGGGRHVILSQPIRCADQVVGCL